MKVRCNKIVSPVDGSRLEESPWVRIGNEYVVLTLLIDRSGRVSVQIHNEDHSPSYWSREMFETTDETVPRNWVARLDPSGLLEFGPPEWLRKGFWEDFWNFVPEARAQYDTTLAVILGDAG